jgi:O-acetyl-ADP-ribose deacetylase (regulator of RNase III)
VVALFRRQSTRKNKHLCYLAGQPQGIAPTKSYFGIIRVLFQDFNKFVLVHYLICILTIKIIEKMHFTKGNLLEAPVDALVNAVNTVGVMGKGIALQFKTKFPQNFKMYQKACKVGELTVGKLLFVQEGEHWIINFPTKQHWKTASKLEYIEQGLQVLAYELPNYPITSIALPALGCGLGGLDWAEVRPLIEKYLGNVENIEVIVYEGM